MSTRRTPTDRQTIKHYTLFTQNMKFKTKRKLYKQKNTGEVNYPNAVIAMIYFTYTLSDVYNLYKTIGQD